MGNQESIAQSGKLTNLQGIFENTGNWENMGTYWEILETGKRWEKMREHLPILRNVGECGKRFGKSYIIQNNQETQDKLEEVRYYKIRKSCENM